MLDVHRQAPVSAATLDALITEIDDPRASARSIAEVVEQDPGLLARVLGLANSAYFGLARAVSETSLAIGLIGTETVRTLAITGATGLLDGRCGLPGVRDHAIAVAAGARVLAPRVGVKPSAAFTAGLLHDIGELLLWQESGDEYRTVRDAAVDAAHQLRVEHDLYDTDHAMLAAEHLFVWRLPEAIVDAVGDHHDPRPGADPLTLVVAAADELADLDGEHAPSGTTALRLLGLAAGTGEVDELRDETADGADQLAALLAGG